MRSYLVIGTRGSLLALTQTRWVQDRLLELFPGLHIDIQIIKTTGDHITDVALSRIGDKGLFTKDLEQALLAGQVDLAVHSLKDLPTQIPEGLCLAAVPERVEPLDVLILRQPFVSGASIPLPQGAKVGSSSLRRRAQLLHHRPDLAIEDVRGNLDTRLRKLEEGCYDALVLAAAGLIRLGWESRITCRLSPETCLPAVGQGALAIEARTADQEVLDILKALEHPATRQAVTAERAFLSALEGGCQVPLAALGEVQGRELGLQGMVASTDGRQLVLHEEIGPAAHPEAIGEKLANWILQHGGLEILRQV